MIPEGERAKISLFSNVPMDCVISVADASTIYEVPLMLHAQGLDDIVCRKLGLETKPADLSAWENIVYRLKHPKRQVTVGMVGKYVDYADSYKSLNEALTHAGIHTETRSSPSSSTRAKSKKRAPASSKASMPSWFRAVSASAAPKA